MPGHHGSETDFENTTLDRLQLLGYQRELGLEIPRPQDEVVLVEVLRASLAARYPDLPPAALESAVARIRRPEGVDTLRRNMAFHEVLTRGFELKVEHPDGRVEHRHIYAIDWDNPGANDFRAVNQLPIHGQNDRRTDIILYVNGLPVVLFELKNPYDPNPTVENAFNQVQHYAHEIPQLFDYNALVVISDGVTTLHGTWTAAREWYAPWKSIDGVHVEPNTTGSMKGLVEGLLPPERLLSYLRDFILFEVANDRITKKAARYHQYFAVRLAAEKALESCRVGVDRRVGVIWHTTGSGKSLSMVFLVGILRRHPELENPTFLIQVDRNDLDDQLFDQFVAARSLVGEVKHAENVGQLRQALRTEGGEVILTTIEKFRLHEQETRHPILSKRKNIFVIADEAHRSQYGFEAGFARYLEEALPNARRLGFTGTPVSLNGADTVSIFGDVIHTYDIRQSQEDHATVPIFYDPRQVRLKLGRGDLQPALQAILAGQEIGGLERRKGEWAALAAAAGARDRLAELADDLLAHFRDRTSTLQGKALVVCMNRENCVRLYDAITALPDHPETRVVMTGDLSKDPAAWSKAGQLTTKAQRDAIKKRMQDPDDPLQIVIVCDMWLTGTDIPCLHTLYVDKPMRGHTMIQAISRVNRVFRDKPHGLIVDYIGIGDELREATSQYTQGGGRGEPAPSIEEVARPEFLKALEEVRQRLPYGNDYGDWRSLAPIALEDRYSLVFGVLTASDDARDAYLSAENRVSQAFLLVKHLDDCRVFADEVIFYQRVRKQILKTLPGKKTPEEVERAVRDLVDDAVDSTGVVDIFRTAGIQRPDISILDDEFLQTFKDKPHPDLRLKLLEKLIRDELAFRLPRNVAKTRDFQQMLEETLRRYHNRLIDAAAVVEAMLRIKKEMDADQERAGQLGLSEEELAFYDTIAACCADIYQQEFLRDLVHDVVAALKRNLKVDWTRPHRADVQAALRAAVKRTLTRSQVRTEDLKSLIESIMTQAESLYADWPLAA